MEPPPEDRPPGSGPPDDGDDEPRPADLLSIGLLVFFVSLIGIVGALLLVPILF